MFAKGFARPGRESLLRRIPGNFLNDECEQDAADPRDRAEEMCLGEGKKAV